MYVDLDAAKEVGAAVITHGNLVQSVINFVIIAFFVFVVLRAAKKQSEKRKLLLQPQH